MNTRKDDPAVLLFALFFAACGGGQAAEAPASSLPSASAAGSSATTEGKTAAPDAGTGAAPVDAAPPVEAASPPHPFASTSLEATTRIDEAVDARVNDVARCVETARAKRTNPHQKISVEIGIDEQGHLIGVKAPPGGPKDPELYGCVQTALNGANFPTSHAGVITVTKSFEEQAVYK